MEIQVAANESSDDLTRDLSAWLNTDDGEWGPVRIREAPSPTDGTLGPVMDALVLATGALGSLASLAGVVVAWLQYRKPDVKVMIFIAGQGNPVSVSAAQAHADPAATADELAGRLRDAMRALPASADSGNSEDGRDGG